MLHLTCLRASSRLPHQLTLQALTANIHYGATGSDVEALLHENLSNSDGRSSSASQLLTTRQDAIQLYRDVWRYSRLFVWSDETGRPWRDVIRESARNEFEQARHETDPAVITRLLLVGREAVMQAKDKFMDKRQKIERDEAQKLPQQGV